MFGLCFLAQALDRLTAQLTLRIAHDLKEMNMQGEQTRIMQEQVRLMQQILATNRERLEAEQAHIVQCEQRYLARLKEAKDLHDPRTIQ